MLGKKNLMKDDGGEENKNEVKFMVLLRSIKIKGKKYYRINVPDIEANYINPKDKEIFEVTIRRTGKNMSQ